MNNNIRIINCYFHCTAISELLRQSNDEMWLISAKLLVINLMINTDLP